MPQINPSEVYTTTETRSLLKISPSTMKRLIKRGAIRANKIGGQYRVLGKEIPPKFGPARRGDVRQTLADVSTSDKLLGIDKKVSFEEGLRRTIDWFRTSTGKPA